MRIIRRRRIKYIYIHIDKLRINARGNIILPLWILRGQTPAVRIDF